VPFCIAFRLAPRFLTRHITTLELAGVLADLEVDHLGVIRQRGGRESETELVDDRRELQIKRFPVVEQDRHGQNGRRGSYENERRQPGCNSAPHIDLVTGGQRGTAHPRRRVCKAPFPLDE